MLMFDLFLLPIVERSPGKALEINGLIAGRDAHAIATLISMPDQMAQLTPSTVGVSLVSQACAF